MASSTEAWRQIPVFLRANESISVPKSYAEGLVLDVFPEPASSTLGASFGQLVEQVGMPTAEALDFLYLSAAIFAADKKAPRRLAEDRWTRHFAVSAPVRDPSVWTTASPSLIEALTFLTGDEWSVQWREERNRIWGARRRANERADAVCLFSGGLDSLVGAIDLLEDPGIGRLLLVGHYDSSFTPGVQRLLARRLQDHYGPERVALVQLWVRPLNPRPTQSHPLPAWRETTTRSRSIIFLGLAVAAASAVGNEIPVYVPENGFIAINAPLIDARLGSCSTRTTHPYFLENLRTALSGVGVDTPIRNEYIHRSKGEMLANCRNQSLLEQLADLSVSCAHPEAGRYERTGYGNCGYCFPCLIRRASLHHVGMDEGTKYRRDVCQDHSIFLPRSTKGRDAKAVFTALYTHHDRARDSRLVAALAGPVTGRVTDFSRVREQGMSELRRLFSDKASEDIGRVAALASEE
jgi:7-cyano-7-deazaguanine synthase in queuosine biosynthesis